MAPRRQNKSIDKSQLSVDFEEAFEVPSKDSFAKAIYRNIGESDEIEFKERWPATNELARHILAMGNSGGGTLISGLAETNSGIEIVGWDSPPDSTDLYNSVKKYLPPSLAEGVKIRDFNFVDSTLPAIKGKRFQAIFVFPDTKEGPFLCNASTTDLNSGVLYIRKGSSSVPADHDGLQRAINRRIETKFSNSKEYDLEQHLTQLKFLYKQIPEFISVTDKEKYAEWSKSEAAQAFQSFVRPFAGVASGIASLMPPTTSKRNPDYPEESYQDFLLKLIRDKKNRIRSELDL